MIKIFFAFALFTVVSCSDKNSWTKDKLVNDCLGEFTKKNEEQKLFTTMQIANLCDCASEKMLAKYKSKRESDKDAEGARQIGSECAQQIMEEASKSMIR